MKGVWVRRDPKLAGAGLVATGSTTLASVLLVGDHPDLIAYLAVGLWAVALSLVGALVASRRPENPIGWLFLLSATFVSLSSLAEGWAERSLSAGTQGAVDRRFNRSRYDAERTIAAFGGRLRSEVELDSLTQDLVGVVEGTMQPAYVSLWLHRGAE